MADYPKRKIGTVVRALIQDDQCVQVEVALDNGGRLIGESRPAPGTCWGPGVAELVVRDVIGTPFMSSETYELRALGDAGLPLLESPASGGWAHSINKPFYYTRQCARDDCHEAHLWIEGATAQRFYCPGPDYVEPEPSPAVAEIRALLDTSIFADGPSEAEKPAPILVELTPDMVAAIECAVEECQWPSDAACLDLRAALGALLENAAVKEVMRKRWGDSPSS